MVLEDVYTELRNQPRTTGCSEVGGGGSGFNDIGRSFRICYEFAREITLYIGINWERKLGKTADMARAGGGHVSNVSLLGGVRMWF